MTTSVTDCQAGNRLVNLPNKTTCLRPLERDSLDGAVEGLGDIVGVGVTSFNGVWKVEATQQAGISLSRRPHDRSRPIPKTLPRPGSIFQNKGLPIFIQLDIG